MNNIQSEKKLMKRRIFYMVSAILLLVGASTLGWYFLAHQLGERVNLNTARLADQGKFIECDNQRVEGYPFRIGLFCDGISYEDRQNNSTFRAGQLRSAAQFYQPGFMIAELDGPGILDLPGPGKLELAWKLARSSSKISLDGIRRISLKLEELSVAAAAGNLKNTPDTDIKLLELHLRAAGDDVNSSDVDLAFYGSEVQIQNISGGNLPLLTIKADGGIADLNTALKSGVDLSRWVKSNGLYLQLRKLEINLVEGGAIKVWGPLQIGTNGLVSARLDVEVANIQALVSNFTAQNPQLGEAANSLRQASAIFEQGTSDGKAHIQIQISNGIIMAGIIPLGTLPRLF